MSPAIDAAGVGVRYGKRWALRNTTLTVPTGHVVGLVGANGSGKTTLLHLVVGLTSPSVGEIEVLGRRPGVDSQQLARVGFVAQDAPLYSSFSVQEHLRLGARLNPGWKTTIAQSRVDRLALDPNQRIDTLSGGQRAQLALTMATGKDPELLVLDEPVASLDPLARREFLQSLMESAADGLSVVLSSHLLSDVERVCDYLIVLNDGEIRLKGEVDELLASHKVLSGKRRDAALPAHQTVVRQQHTDRQTTLLVSTDQPILDPWWNVSDVDLEDLVIAYMQTTTKTYAPLHCAQDAP